MNKKILEAILRQFLDIVLCFYYNCLGIVLCNEKKRIADSAKNDFKEYLNVNFTPWKKNLHHFKIQTNSIF